MLRELSAGGAPIRISAAHGTEFVDAIDIGDDPVALERRRLAREHLTDTRRIDSELDAIQLTGRLITELHHRQDAVEGFTCELVDGADGLGRAFEAAGDCLVGRHEDAAEPTHRDACGRQAVAARPQPFHRGQRGRLSGTRPEALDDEVHGRIVNPRVSN